MKASENSDQMDIWQQADKESQMLRPNAMPFMIVNHDSPLHG